MHLTNYTHLKNEKALIIKIIIYIVQDIMGHLIVKNKLYLINQMWLEFSVLASAAEKFNALFVIKCYVIKKKLVNQVYCFLFFFLTMTS